MDRRWKASIAAAVMAVGCVAGLAGGSPAAVGAPASFTTTIDNPYYPLPPGQLLVYHGVRDGEKQVDRVFVTDQTKLVNGVTTVVVRDIARNNAGVLIEKTFDWFAQDDLGNVWYFGEDTTEYDAQRPRGRRRGSVDSTATTARCRGIVMEAQAQGRPTRTARSTTPGEAEDQAWMVQTGMHVEVPYGPLDGVLRSMEWARIEPRVVDMKFYAPGIGIVLEKALAGGQEVSELTKVSGP